MCDAPVLFIDDNLWCHLDNCNILRECGFIVEEAYCASQAIELIDRRRPLRAMVTDIDLGAGPDGFDLARRVRTAHPRLPVIYISGAAARRHCTEGVEGSIFIAKPFEPQQIVEALRGVTCLVAA